MIKPSKYSKVKKYNLKNSFVLHNNIKKIVMEENAAIYSILVALDADRFVTM